MSSKNEGGVFKEAHLWHNPVGGLLELLDHLTETQEFKTDRGDSLVGQVFEGRFEILSVLGQGGMGMVYKARHIHMDKIVAIKTLVQGAAYDDNSFLRFEQEARTASSLDHPNIIKIIDFGRSGLGFAYLVMEYINGVTLEDVIIESEVPLDRFLRIFKQACEGMQHAHKKGIIHRDLKPTNLMIYDAEDAFDKVKIVDFGLAKLAQDDTQKLTQSGVVMGSPLYMSPEQGRGDELDIRSDIYSLGCVMYVALSGHVPLKGNNSMATIYKHISDVPQLMSQVAPHIYLPKRLEEVVMRSLEKDPNLRPQTMEELSFEIEEAIHSTNATHPISLSQSISAHRTVSKERNDLHSSPQPAQIPVTPRDSAPGASALSAGSSPSSPSPSAGTGSGTGSPLVSPSAIKLGVLMLLLLFCGFAAGEYATHHSGPNEIPPEISGSSSSAKSTVTPGSNQPSNASPGTSGTASNAASANATVPKSNSGQGVAICPPNKTSAGSNNKVLGQEQGTKTTNTTATSEPAKGAASKSDPLQSNALNSNAKSDKKNLLAATTPTIDSASERANKAELGTIGGESSAEKAIAKQLLTKYSNAAMTAFRAGDYSEAEGLFEKQLEQERILSGTGADPHMIPTLSHLLTCLQSQGLNNPKTLHYLDQALNAFRADRDLAVRFTNSKPNPVAIWKTLATTCFDMAQMQKGKVRLAYSDWSTTFFELVFEQWNAPKNGEYFKLLRSYSIAALQCRKIELSRRLKDELVQNGQLVPSPDESGIPDPRAQQGPFLDNNGPIGRFRDNMGRRFPRGGRPNFNR